LIFESTRNFSQSEIQPVFRSFEKFLVNPNLYAIIPPPGEKCGLDTSVSRILSGEANIVSRRRSLAMHTSAGTACTADERRTETEDISNPAKKSAWP
jgi:hypothetical protein